VNGVASDEARFIERTCRLNKQRVEARRREIVHPCVRYLRAVAEQLNKNLQSRFSVDNFQRKSHSKVTRSSADADKPTLHVYRLVKVTKRGTIQYVRYGFLLLFYSNFVPKKHRF